MFSYERTQLRLTLHLGIKPSLKTVVSYDQFSRKEHLSQDLLVHWAPVEATEVICHVW